MIPHIITPDSVTVMIENRMRTVRSGAPNFEALRAAVRKLSDVQSSDQIAAVVESIKQLVDIPMYVARVTVGKVKICDDAVYYQDAPVHGVIRDRLLALLQEGLDVIPLARFLDRVSSNPSITARDDIYRFLESGNMPLTSDGCFLAFKKVKEDYSSTHLQPDGTPLFNKIGTTVTMMRADVDPDRNNTCSRGLHFCSFQYLGHFGAGEGARVVIVKIAPEDVVSIPTDYNHSKGRAWRYVVIGEVAEEECRHLFDKTPAVNSFGLYDGTDEVFDADDDDDFRDGDCVDCGRSDLDCMCYVDGLEEEDDDETVDFIEVERDTFGEEDIDAHPPIEEKAADQVFKHGRKTYTAAEVKQMCSDYGQRGFSRMTGVPRTTLQGWLSKI